MDKLLRTRNAQMVQVVGELAAVGKLAERNASYSEATERLEQLKELARNFRKTQSTIEENFDDPEALDSVHNFREEFNGAYFQAKNVLEKCIANYNPDEIDSTSSSGTVIDQDLRDAMKMLHNAQRSLLEGQQAAALASISQVRGSFDPVAGEQVSNRVP